LSIALGIGQFFEKERTRFPRDFAVPIKVPHGIAASFVLPKDVDKQLTFGEVHVVGLYVLVGHIGPEPKGISYPQFHGGFRVGGLRSSALHPRSMKN
jgi:hypothetical protein